ncbi:glutathione synthase [Cysteiniphilum sp. JM-1]|uniref:glutathione synthase n=1 Tax=Cysteiniphilum sp. JM-1 TaxID=2610891 RepID=UPI001245E859|nr:glutathione synthase [Cysteiniphilum sp. JM-1]
MKVAFIIDPLHTFNIKKDTAYMMMLSVAKKDWQQYVFELEDIFVEEGVAYGEGYELTLTPSKEHNKWYHLNPMDKVKLGDFDVIFMRKDPPFNMEFVYATYILELAEKQGALIINKPQTLRDANEKFSITRYPDLAPKTMVSRSFKHIKRFIDDYQDVVVKPLDGMGGESIFRIQPNDPNKNVILETITKYESQFIMVQQYQPAIKDGDKRILIVDGEPLEYLVARIPSGDDSRGNLARGASTVVRKLTAEEYEIASIVGRDLKQSGVLFAGIDVIGDCLTEINITSPTMTQQIFNESGVNATDILMDVVEDRVMNRK